VRAVGQCGGGPGQVGFSWSRVALLLLGGTRTGTLGEAVTVVEGGRNKVQCRNRWVGHLQPAALGQVAVAQGGDAWTMHEVRK
jgi:hypothetical protein